MGFKLDRWDGCKDRDRVKLKLRIHNRDAVLNGRIYRKDSNGKAVVVFSEDDGMLSRTVGLFLTGYVRDAKRCPYCRVDLTDDGMNCPNCRMPLDFTRVDLIKALRRIKIGDFVMGRFPEEIREKACQEKTEFVGTCESMKRVFDLIRKYASTRMSR